MSEPGTLVALLVLGALTAADTTAFLQIMVSQPLAAAFLGGMVMGNPAAGLAVGIALQGVWGRSLPVGGASLPLGGPAAVAAGALAARIEVGRGQAFHALELPDAVSLAVILGVALAAGELGRWVVVRVRRRRIAWVAGAERTAGDGSRLTGYVLLGFGQSLVMGVLLCGVAHAVGRFLLSAAGPLPVLDGRGLFLIVVGLGVGQTLLLLPVRRGALALGVAAVLWSAGAFLS